MTVRVASEPSAVTRSEVEHLLTYLERSGCDFERNGTWYNAVDARAHLEKKYRYLVDRDLVTKAEDFIARAAAQSSMSGQPYQVRCAGTRATPSAAWLTNELQRYRQVQSQSRKPTN